MKPFLPTLTLLTCSLSVVPHAAADLLEGTVLAFDRVANVLVMQDKSVMPLETLESVLPDDLEAGDRVEISFQSNEDDGIRLVHSVVRLD